MLRSLVGSEMCIRDSLLCLFALDNLGATNTSLGWVAAFLFGRQMSVKVRKELSAPRLAPGGSPQGSILGNFLFCSTTNSFAELTPEVPTISSHVSTTTDENTTNSPQPESLITLASTPTNALSTPTTRGQFAAFRPPACLLNLSGDFESDDDLSLIHI